METVQGTAVTGIAAPGWTVTLTPFLEGDTATFPCPDRGKRT